MKKALIPIIGLLILIFIISCNKNKTTSKPESYFRPDNPEPPPNSVSLQPEENNKEHIKIKVYLNEISVGKVYAAAFDLVFRYSVIEYEGFEPGDFLEQGGQVTYQIVTDEGNPGRLIVGISLLGESEGVDGSGNLVYLKFKAKEYETTPLVFENNELRDPTPPDGKKLTGISWYAGRVDVQ